MRRIAWVILALVVLHSPGAEKRPLEALVKVLASSDDVDLQRDVLRGMSDALAGRRTVKAPAGWSAVFRKCVKSSDPEVRERVLALSVVFGDPEAMATLHRIVESAKGDPGARERALATLLDRRAEGVPELLRKLLDDGVLRRAALRGLAHYDDPKTPHLILGRYGKLSPDEKADAVGTLSSRPAYALALLEAMEKKQVARGDVSPFVARQLVSLGNKQVSDRLNAVWGSIRVTTKDREKLLARYKAMATPDRLKKADRAAGRVVWAKTCASCHVLFGEGGKIGPDLTGSQRTNPEYILHKVLDPNAVVPRDYQTTRIVTVFGRILIGIVKQENDKVVLLQTATEEVRIATSDIEQRDRQTTSLMPEGQLAVLSDKEIRDLLAYLAGNGPVPLKK
jgi:putative heme-binding domain-containing protein